MIHIDKNIIEAIETWILYGIKPGSCTELLLRGKYEDAYEHAHPVVKRYWDNHVTYIKNLPPEFRGKNFDTWKGTRKAKRIVYWKDGSRYYKLERDEVIDCCAIQSWCNGELQPLMNTDGNTIGSTPSEFSDERDFYNPLPFDMVPTIEGQQPMKQAVENLSELANNMIVSGFFGPFFERRLESIESLVNLIKKYNDIMK